MQEARLRGQKENREQQTVLQGDNMAEETSPFTAISATMGWETFYMVQTLWLNIIDLPCSSKEKDWELQACL